MARRLIHVVLAGGLLLSACGDQEQGAKPQSPSADRPEMTLAQFRQRTHLCFTPRAVWTSGGKRIADSPTRAELLDIYEAALAPSVRGNIKGAFRFVPSSHEAELKRLEAAVEKGLAAMRANPELIRTGGGFGEAQRLATQSGLAACLPLFRQPISSR